MESEHNDQNTCVQSRCAARKSKCVVPSGTIIVGTDADLDVESVECHLAHHATKLSDKEEQA